MSRWLIGAIGIGAIALLPMPVIGIGTEEEEPSALSASSEDTPFQRGKQALRNQQWLQAVTLFRQVTVSQPDSADAWNYLAYSYRQLGELDLAFAAYHKALALNPKHRGAHEYIGEAYVQIRNLAKAQFHLKQLAAICGPTCEEYQELKKAIESYSQ